MNPLQQILALSEANRKSRGLLFTPSEIAQQPATWVKTAELLHSQRASLQQFLRPIRTKEHTFFLIGAGTSDYIGDAIAPLLRERWRCEVSVTPSTDLLTQRNNLLIAGKQYLWIHFSRSGDSPEGVAVLEQAVAALPEILHLVITCNAQGKMAKLAKGCTHAYVIVLDDAVNDRSLAMTSSFTNMVLAGQGLADLWEEQMFPSLEAMIEAAEYLLEEGSSLAAELAAQKFERICFLGTGSLTATARESALKSLELTAGRVVTMWESSLGLRHGPMSALNRSTLLCSFVSSQGNANQYDKDVLQEVNMKEAVGSSVAIGTKEMAAKHHLYSEAFLRIPDLYRPPVDIIFGQLLGLFSSIQHDLSPDSPSPQGVITRVVPPFPIYPQV